MNSNRTYFSNSADMSFEGDTSEGSKNSNSNDGGGGADADLVYFDESEMRFVFSKNLSRNMPASTSVNTKTMMSIHQMDRHHPDMLTIQNVKHPKGFQKRLRIWKKIMRIILADTKP